jgi:hypothetical protein
MKEQDGFRDELVINYMPHELYVAVVDYIEGLPNHIENRSKPLRINGIDKIHAENPPRYEGVHIGIESYGFREAKEHASEAVQGLAKIIFGELSLPSGMRQSK